MDAEGELDWYNLRVDSKETSYIELLQGVIGRMAGSSSNCKAWCIAIVSALLAAAVERQSEELALTALLPIGLFFYLDSYYLSLERDFISLFESFTAELRAGTSAQAHLFVFKTPQGMLVRGKKIVLAAVGSPSTLPVYGALAVIVSIVAWRLYRA